MDTSGKRTSMARALVLLVAALAAALLLGGCSSQASKAAEPPTTDNYTLDATWTTKGMTLHYPSDWTLTNNNDAGTRVRITMPFSGVILTGYEGQFHFKDPSKERQPEDALMDAAKSALEKYKKNYPDLVFGDNPSYTSEEFDGKKGIVRAIIPTNGSMNATGGGTSKVRGFFWLAICVDGEGYGTKYSGLFVAGSSDYEEHKGDLKGIIESIEIVKDPNYDYDAFNSSSSKDSSSSVASSSSSTVSNASTSTAASSGTTGSAAAQTVKSYQAGTYRVGIDCPAGEYKLTASGSGYFCVYPDTTKADILANSNFDQCEYITVSDGQCFEVKRATFVPRADAKPNSGTLTGHGRYLVGFDCPAGEYKLTQTGGSMGYYCINESSNVDAHIVDNNNFEGNDFCTVAEGQYLELSRCTAEPA